MPKKNCFKNGFNFRKNFRKIVLRKKTLIVAIALITLLLMAIIILGIKIPLRTFFAPQLFKDFINQYEGYVDLIFIVVYSALTVIGIPGTVLTIVGGSLFGLWYGTFISIISATLGSLLSFLAARYLLQNFAQRRFKQSKRLTKYQTAILKQPFTFVLATRLIPISPYNLVNYLFGLTSINWLDYTFATFIGVIPGCFAYTWIGVSGKSAMEGGDRLSFYLALTFLASLSMIPIVYQRAKKF